MEVFKDGAKLFGRFDRERLRRITLFGALDRMILRAPEVLFEDPLHPRQRAARFVGVAQGGLRFVAVAVGFFVPETVGHGRPPCRVG